MYTYGIILALVAMLFWAFGDFFIQKTSREYGVWTSIACVVFLGSVVLFPWAVTSIPEMFQVKQLVVLVGVAAVSTVAALASFKSFQASNMSVVEPVMAFELPLTVVWGVLLLHESLIDAQVVLIVIVFIGILFTSSKNIFKSKIILEKGVWLAGGAMVLMSVVNFTTGLASQNIGAVETIWFVHTFISIICIGYFSITRSWGSFFAHVKKYPKESFLVAFFDNGAWLAYSAAVILIPISLAITLSEGYIVLAMVLGVIINKEKLSKYQWFGAALAFIAVMVLAYISG